MSEVPPPLPSRRDMSGVRVPVVSIILIAWISIYLLMMWHGGWRWNTGGILGFGIPRPGTLRQFGVLVPAELRWQSFWLSGLLHRSLLGLVFLVFFWRATGRQMVMVLGPSWTFVTFVVGGAAGAAAHAAAHAGSPSIGGAGPFDPILCAVGAQLGWGMLHREARPLVRSSLWTILMICLWMGIILFAQGVRDITSPGMREALGLEAMLGALTAGVALALAIGLTQRLAGGAAAWAGRGLAVLLALGMLGAVVTQAGPIVRSAERQEALEFLQQLRRVERAVDRLLDQREATPAKRERLALEHGRLVQHGFLESYAGKAALLEYAEVLHLYTQPVDAPFITEPQLRKRFTHWHTEYEAPLRKEFALPRRESPWRDD